MQGNSTKKVKVVISTIEESKISSVLLNKVGNEVLMNCFKCIKQLQKIL